MSQSANPLRPSTSTSSPWVRSTPAVTTTVQIRPDGVVAEILDTRPECLAGFAALDAEAQHLLVHDAWTVGMRAILNARAEAQEAQLSNIAQTLKEDLANQLERHTQHTTERLQSKLAEYFDPESGCVGERLQRFLGDDGVLVRQLRSHVGLENSTLAAALAKSLGEHSPLFKKLSPTDSEGLVHVVAEQLRRVLQEEHQQFQKALDPLQTEGAVGQFLTHLRELLKTAESDEAQQIKLALKQLDANDERSLLSQLRRDMTAAQKELIQAVNPDHPGSPLGIIQDSLTKLLQAHIKTQQEREEAARQRAEAFHKDIRERLERMETRKRVEQRTAPGGRTYEDVVVGFVQRLLGPNGYLVEPTGDSPGATRSKRGDATIDFPVDHPFHGCRIVVEAKHHEKYTLGKARAELEEARANRQAQIGLFVLARSHAADTFPTFVRCGQDVFVVWDEEDPNQAPYLEGAVMVALALATRKSAQASEASLKALHDIEERVSKAIASFDKVKRLVESIRANADKITEEIGKGSEQLRSVVSDARATLAALNLEPSDTTSAQASPIVLGSCP